MTDPFEGWQQLGWVEEDPDNPEVAGWLNDYVAENFTEVSREVDGTAVYRHLTRQRPQVHCTCAVFGILDPSITPVRVYSRDCGLLAHRLQADPPRQEP